MTARALVLGFGVTGEAVARHVDPAGLIMVVDEPTDATRERAAAAGIDLVERPDEAASARLLGHVAVANAGDAVVMAATRGIDSRLLTFGTGGDYRCEGGILRTPSADLLPVDALPRRLPLDIANALAGAASAMEAGATAPSCRAVL